MSTHTSQFDRTIQANQVDMDDRSDLDFDCVILVTRGDELPKKNYEKKKHPTYETSIRIKYAGQASNTRPHLVIKFFNQYRDLYDSLQRLGVGENLKVHVDAPFPPSYTGSTFGMGLNEDQLQERCYLLNKWMQAVFAAYHLFPPEGQKLISDFLSLEDDDAACEANKELILSLLRRKQQRAALFNQGAAPPPPSTTTPAKPSPASTQTSAPTTSTVPVTSQAVVATTESSGDVSGSAPASSISQQPALRLGSANDKPKRGISAAFSVVSEAPMLSGAEMEEYSKEAVMHIFLAVSVLRGDMIPKSKDDTKLHHSYETIVRILPLAEAQAADTTGQLAQILEDVDAEAYHNTVTAVPPVSVAKVFDGYRQLMLDLENEGVFSKDHSYKAELYDADESTRRRAVVVDAAFPKTFRRSSLGIGLSEQQLQMRMVMLNFWVGQLLRSFPSLPKEAQQLILNFLELTLDGNADGGEEHKPAANGQSNVIISMLRGQFQAPKKKPVAPPPPPPSKTTSFFGGGGNSAAKSADKATADTPEPAPVVLSVPWIYIAHPNGSGTGVPGDNISEYIVNTFLGVRVSQGEKLLRKSNDSKMHTSYEIRIRILSFHDLPFNEKSEMDQEAYNKLSRLPAFTVAKVFDSYRTLKNALEERRVVSRDRVDAHNSTGGCVVIDAVFPPTYGKSSLGIGLTEQEKMERASMLNVWMTALLSRYAQCTPESQELIRAFLGLEEDNPAEPQNATIHAVLKRTFRPAVKPPPAPPSNSSNKQNRASTGGTGGSRGGQSNEPVATGCACVIS